MAACAGECQPAIALKFGTELTQGNLQHRAVRGIADQHIGGLHRRMIQHAPWLIPYLRQPVRPPS